MKKILFTLTAVFALCFGAVAQVDTINAKNNKLQLKNLKEGVVNYLVYMSDTSLNKRQVGDIWERKTKFNTLNGRSVVTFDWKWLHADTLLATVVNICDAKTLAPIYHYADYKGRGIIAYDYTEGWMVPTDSVKNNMAIKKGKVQLPIPVISWEQDLETYATLPINKVGQKFDVSFFDPNEKAPSYHRYEVVGKEDLPLNSDVKVKCWVLKINYTADSWAMFWLTEKSKEVIKMKEYFRGKYRFKVRQY